MKKTLVFTLLVVLLFFPSLVLRAQTPPDSTSGSALGKIWSKLTSSAALSEKDLIGKWDYRGSACTFETENLLKKAGGSVVATQVENKFDDYLQKVGVRKGTSYFTFNDDGSYSAKLGVAKLSGKYSLDEKTKMLTMSYMLGVAKMHPRVVKSGKTLKLMYDADSFLKLMKTLSMFTKDNSIEILAAMADLYDGMLLGFDVAKGN